MKFQGIWSLFWNPSYSIPKGLSQSFYTYYYLQYKYWDNHMLYVPTSFSRYSWAFWQKWIPYGYTKNSIEVFCQVKCDCWSLKGCLDRKIIHKLTSTSLKIILFYQYYFDFMIKKIPNKIVCKSSVSFPNSMGN